MRTSTPLSSLALTVALVCMALVVFAKTREVPEDLAYVGSDECADCHRAEYEAWSGSQHTKMMRRVDAPGVVVADFDDPELLFDPSEVVWAIGGKWEQQFMGHDGESETLLPGSWHAPVGEWDFRGWDGWERPLPVERCHGCHSVGLDVETGGFVEPNIGCESCHGPGEWHVATLGLGRIHSSADAQVCGQCHVRGTTPDQAFFFPVGYRPGLELDDFFSYSEPSPGQNSSHWWGNGHARQRHQEYAAWRETRHARSLESLGPGYDGRFGEVTDDCLGCHAAEAAIDGADGLGAPENGVTCNVCHNVHGSLSEPRVGCDACHTQGAYEHTPERNAGHVPCPPGAEVACVDCHAPASVTIGGAFVLHDHGPGFVPPRDTERFGTPSGCANGGCHPDASPAALQARYEAHYGTAAQTLVRVEDRALQE